MKEIVCPNCGTKVMRHAGHVNRSRKIGANIYCSRRCSGIAKRTNLTLQEKKERKRLYDIAYRAKTAEKRRKRAAEWFKNDYAKNPEKYKQWRAARKKYHAEYCRHPEYKIKKHTYDRARYARQAFGPLWEIHVLAMSVTEEAQKQLSKFEMMQQKGRINLAQKRKRNAKAECRIS